MFDFNGIDELKSFIGNLVRMDGFELVRQILVLRDAEPIPGALEDLCWDILNDDHACKMRKDVLDFIDDIKKNYGTITTHEHKSRLHTYFSVNEDYISLKIGEAAKAGAFAWDHCKLDGLRDIMLQGLSFEASRAKK